VAIALGFIRQNACRGIDVDDVLRRVLVSRSVLQRRFQKAVGKPIHAVILAERLRRVKDLLTETQLPRDRIARQTGFEHPEYLSRMFKQQTGMTMSRYRREHGRRSR
jgi:LacI family transcriptional regulator